MELLYIALGLILTRVLKNSEVEEIIEESPAVPATATTTTTFTRQFNIHKDRPEPIRPEDITISLNPKINEKNRDKNINEEVILPLIWAYYQAYIQGLLVENSPLPWEKIEEDITIKNRKLALQRKNWFNFMEYFPLTAGLEDINNPEELKKLTLETFAAMRD